MIIRFTYYKLFTITLFVILVIFFIVPNLFNTMERASFSDVKRLYKAKAEYNFHNLGDSVEVVPGVFYRSNSFKRYFLGESYRELWQQKIKVAVLDLTQKDTRYIPVAFTGGLQTIGIKVKDSIGQLWSIRSVNKDQAVALPEYLRSSVLRPLFRDRACSMDPYGSIAAAKFSQAIGLHAFEPRLFLFPYNDQLGKYNDRMAGRLVLIQRRWDSGTQLVNGEKLSILDTEDAFARVHNKEAVVDSIHYLRCRLFDMLISDWDRHNGNWKWFLKFRSGKPVLEPIAVDRDMAFYNFGGGVINHIALFVDQRFQSFDTKFDNIKGLMQQSEHLDKAFLKNVQKKHFLEEAKLIQAGINDQLITETFRTYPVAAFNAVGESHEYILKERLRKLPLAAEKFFRLIHLKD